MTGPGIVFSNASHGPPQTPNGGRESTSRRDGRCDPLPPGRWGGRVKRHFLWENLFRRGGRREQPILDVLARIPMFEDLSGRELRAVERVLHRRSYGEGEAVFYEGEPGLGMYIIESGTITITLGDEHAVVAELQDGDFFGEIALLLDDWRTATATARTEAKLLGFFRPELFALLDESPKLGTKVLRRLAHMMARRLETANRENRRLERELAGRARSEGA